MLIGYVRVSAKDQNAGRQLIKMEELGITGRYLFVEKQSGKDFDRTQYQAMRQMIREGDVVYFDALDRLGRDYDGILSEWKYITRELNADIVCLENESLFDSRRFKQMDSIDEDGKRIGFGKLLEDQFLSMLAYVAETERKKILKRQREGIDLCLSTGKTKTGRAYGRPETVVDEREFNKVYRQFKDKQLSATQAAKLLGLTRQTFYRKVAKRED